MKLPVVQQQCVAGPSSSMCPMGQMRQAASPSPFPQLEGRHPCYSLTAEGHTRSGRLHLPVSPACNLRCGFCKREFNGYDKRPGVARELLTPEQALGIVARALELCPAINVIGIAGPGDTLVTDHAIRTFELVHAAYPQLINCLSTNGLLLEEKAARVIAAGVQTITVTVNAVNPVIQARICPTIAYHGKLLRGEEGAALLIAHQLAGIRGATGLGAVVKVNTVLVPGINDHHVGEIARAAAEAGASLINIIPLIPQHELAHVPPPTPAQLIRARLAAEQHLRVFTHCNRCRADACGIPGETDFADKLYDERVAMTTFSHG